jgi:hypothetical protein
MIPNKPYFSEVENSDSGNLSFREYCNDRRDNSIETYRGQRPMEVKIIIFLNCKYRIPKKAKVFEIYPVTNR